MQQLLLLQLGDGRLLLLLLGGSGRGEAGHFLHGVAALHGHELGSVEELLVEGVVAGAEQAGAHGLGEQVDAVGALARVRVGVGCLGGQGTRG